MEKQGNVRRHAESGTAEENVRKSTCKERQQNCRNIKEKQQKAWKHKECMETAKKQRKQRKITNNGKL